MVPVEGNANSSEVMMESATCESDIISPVRNLVLTKYEEELFMAKKLERMAIRPNKNLHATYKLPRPGTLVLWNAGLGDKCRLHGVRYHEDRLRDQEEDKTQGIKTQGKQMEIRDRIHSETRRLKFPKDICTSSVFED